ncbi:acyl-CoA dehydrogenase [Aeromicrobium sp. SMF47]|uniref:Acyl-CoA dehydrogenase n=1 Tax=Aeromicrobium yanjiei TaxID=2662028 RepID=A0A5Q2MG11_9ACTN|nr:acyl-CoA dehydrogenase family protein [Aeromicrobium yanjiei]MRJ77292.1 acyl-CoA dehydrogenase [Aeromicrobium yanjiei]QGG41578.1 acyl-CoA dehydrogenase [Aeromicrobium yanjiei]
MRLDISPELEAFRHEVRTFVAQSAPGSRPHAGVRAPHAEQVPAIRAWIAALFEAGYLGMSWPEEFGGQADPVPEHAFIVAEELARARAWEQIGAGSLGANALIEFGTDAQKQHLLPRIRSGQDLWCQLFSEPGAGSDLAGLQTRARLDGDEYVVDGQKVWTTNGQHADIGYLLARTDPTVSKHRGITAFAIDMRTPGVDIRPLREITGTSDFNEVFLDSVRIPADRVIGEVNDGWRVANSSLGHERSGVAARGAELFAMLDDLLDFAQDATFVGRPALRDSGVRQRIGKVATDIHVTDLMSKVVQSRMVHGTEDAADAPLVKIFYSEVNHAAAELGVSLQGVDGLAVEGDENAVANGWWQDAFMYARALTIAGGANEVLRTVVAERSYGLPREPR